MKSSLPPIIQQSIEHIQQDNTSGSVELAKKSAETILNLIHLTTNPTQIRYAAHQLIQAQPTMAPIINLVNQLLITIENTQNQSLNHIIEEYCEHFLHDLETADKSISRLTNPLIKNNTTIITHSYSSTILNSLLYAQQSGKTVTVICTESRPKNEGIQLAKKLANNNIPVKLIVDSAVFSFKTESANGLINKIGTSGIALAAIQQNIPIYALCSTIKYLPPAYHLQLHQIRNPNEIIKTKSVNITPINYYFDITPLEHLTGIITENTILKLPEVQEKIAQLTLHPSLA